MSESVRTRLLGVWRRVLSLSWPIMAEQTLTTLMRTTDVVVTALFSPAAVAALGLADLFARLPLRIGLGLGSGAIALSSQDTGASKAEGAEDEVAANRDEAITQAIVVGILAGIPLVLFGFLAGTQAIARARLATISEAFSTHLSTSCGIGFFLHLICQRRLWCSRATPATVVKKD